MGDLSRQDRIRINKDRKGIGYGKPSITEIKEGIPEFRTFHDSITGEQTIKQYIRRGARLYESDFSTGSRGDTQQSALWYLSKEVVVSSTGTTKALGFESGTYIMDVRILVTSAITAGSMDVDVGIGSNVDVFIDGWDGTAGSNALGTINAFGRGSAATETGVKVGKFFTTADTIDVLVNTAATVTDPTGKIRLLVLMVKNPVITKYLGTSSVK